MSHWIYTFLFALSLLIIGKYLFILLLEVASSSPNPIKLTWKEQLTVAVALSFVVTFLTY